MSFTKSDVLKIGREGLICISVCVPKDMEPKQIEEFTNDNWPTGLPSCWTISEDKTFATGQPMPCACEHKPETRKHYLLNC